MLYKSAFYSKKSSKLDERISKFGKQMEDIDKLPLSDLSKWRRAKVAMMAASNLIAKKAKFDKISDRHYVAPMLPTPEIESEPEQTTEGTVL